VQSPFTCAVVLSHCFAIVGPAQTAPAVQAESSVNVAPQGFAASIAASIAASAPASTGVELALQAIAKALDKSHFML